MIKAGASDFPSLVALLAVIYYSILFTNIPKQRYLLAICSFSIISVWFRYAYFPIVLAIPLIFLLNKNKYNILFTRWFFVLLINFLGIIALAAYNYYSAEEVAFTGPSEFGFYPENLLEFPEIFWSSFMSVNFYCTQAALLNITGYSRAFNFFKISGVLVFLILLSFFFLKAKKKKLTMTSFSSHHFFLITGWISIVLVCFLAAISLVKNAILTYPYYSKWTFFSEQRYFAMVEAFIPIFLYYLLLVRKSLNRLLFYAKIIFFIIIFFDVIHNFYFITRITFFEQEEKIKHSERFIPAHLNSTVSKYMHNGIEPIIVSNTFFMMAYATFNNIKIMDEPQKLDILAATKAKRLSLILADKKPSITDKSPLDGFLQAKKLAPTTIGNYSFYYYCVNCNLVR